MWGDVTRTAGSLLSIPASLAVGVARAAIDAPCVLEVPITPQEDARARLVLLRRLERAASDPLVSAVLLDIAGVPGRFAACDDLRQVITKLRASGKPVYASFESAGNATMWIASACDVVFLVPTGELMWIGLCSEMAFFGDLLDRVGIEPDFVAAGTYKSFGEPFLRKFASPANQESSRALLSDLQDQMVRGVAAGRGLTVEVVRDLLDRGPLSADQALDSKLVDRLAYHDEVKAFVAEKHPKAKVVEFAHWSRKDAASEWAGGLSHYARSVTVLQLDGAIVSGEDGPGTRIRSKQTCKALDELYEDKDVSAVVLHVDSPGGSALASDVIWREVDRLARTRPVVACFEDVAASGGFYLSAPAAKIFARPSTITGSIGVFGGKLVVGEALRRVGVNTQLLPVAANADMYAASRRWTDAQRDLYKGTLQRFYDGFVERVAAGRKRPVSELEPHCRGRVWTGKQAQALGLIDELGGLAEAVAAAGGLAHLKPGTFDVRYTSVQPNRSVFARMLQNALRRMSPVDVRMSRLLTALDGFGGDAADVVLAHPNEPLALLPYTVSALR